MFWFKSKSKDQKEKQKDAKQNSRQANTSTSEEITSDTPSLLEVDMLISKKSYNVFAHDQGRKQLDKVLKNNIK